MTLSRLKSLGLYPILRTHSIISGMSIELLLMPDFLTASMVAKFDCKLFKALIASLYVRRFIVAAEEGGAAGVVEKALWALIYWGEDGT